MEKEPLRSERMWGPRNDFSRNQIIKSLLAKEKRRLLNEPNPGGDTTPRILTSHVDKVEQALNNNDILKKAPRWADFRSIYNDDDIISDSDDVEKEKNKQHYYDRINYQHTTNYDLLEASELAGMVEDGVLSLITEWNIFADGNKTDTSLDSPGHKEIRAIHTAEYDDWLNHSDIVCVIQNRLTEDRPVPFIIDTTYNPKDAKIREKMKWSHPRYPGIKGAMMIKYYKDLDADNDDILPMGRIDIAPRFVVSYNPEVLPGDALEEIDKKQACIFNSLTIQSRGMLESLKRQYPDGKMPSKIAQYKKNLEAIDQYFARAYRIFKEGVAEDSKAYDGMPKSEFYVDPVTGQRAGRSKSYQDTIMQYPDNPNVEAASQKINSIAQERYGI